MQREFGYAASIGEPLMANIAQLLFNRVRRTPSALALSEGSRRIDFAALGENASRLAGALRATAGLVPGDRVVLWMENRIEFFELLWACWIAGLCAVPANVKLHPREVAHIAADCGAREVFVGEAGSDDLAAALADSAAAPSLRTVYGNAWRAFSAAPPIGCVDVAPNDTAWLFYTSGTTGRPKGAMLTHRNLVFMALAYYADIERVAPGDTQLHAAPLSHGSGLYGIPHLLAGGHQAILPGFDPQAVLAAFERYSNVSLFAAPTMVSRLVQAAGTGGAGNGLRTLIYGGGPMYVNDLVAALDRFGPRLYQLYGQGESPMTITGLSQGEHVGERSPAHLAKLGSCGTARTGVEVKVVDDAGRDLPVGEPGEIVTRSDCVMAGYWNAPVASAAALNGGWLKTGDVGSFDESGYLTLRDRSKDLIISGGSNIYPREIEEVLMHHPAVFECSVVGRPHADWGEEPVAFVVVKPGMALAAEDLDRLCLANIARFKRPKEYRYVETLPKNNYGKVLKTDLRRLLAEESPAPCDQPGSRG